MRKASGFLPGFHLIGGRGSSIWAMVQSCFASLHSAKATGRPRSFWRLPFPVRTYWRSTSRRSACASVTRSWIASWRLRMRPWTTTSATLSSGCSDSATASGTSPSCCFDSSGVRIFGREAATSAGASGTASISIGSASSPAPPVVAHPAEDQRYEYQQDAKHELLRNGRGGSLCHLQCVHRDGVRALRKTRSAPFAARMSEQRNRWKGNLADLDGPAHGAFLVLRVGAVTHHPNVPAGEPVETAQRIGVAVCRSR